MEICEKFLVSRNVDANCCWLLLFDLHCVTRRLNIWSPSQFNQTNQNETVHECFLSTFTFIIKIGPVMCVCPRGYGCTNIRRSLITVQRMNTPFLFRFSSVIFGSFSFGLVWIEMWNVIESEFCRLLMTALCWQLIDLIKMKLIQRHPGKKAALLGVY